MKKVIKAFLFLIGCLTLSCEKDPMNDGELYYALSPTGHSASVSTNAAASGQVVALLTDGSINWTSGILHVSKIQFGGKKNATNINLELTNLSNVNISNPGTIVGNIKVPAGAYTDIQLKGNFVQSTANMPLVLKGTYKEANGGAAIPVEVQFNENLELNTTPPNVTVQGQKYTANITLAFNKLVTGLVASDFGQTQRTQPNNTILVTSTLNTSLYSKLKANLLTIANAQITAQ